MRSLIIATALMLLSSVFLPAYSAGVPANASWGFEYDWSYLDQDTEYLSSVNLDDIVTIIEEADEKGGFNIAIDYALGGKTHFYNSVETLDPSSLREVTDGNGDKHFVTERVTTYTVRHASTGTSSMHIDWGDSKASFDYDLSLKLTDLVIIDIQVIEFFNANNELVGADVTSGGEIQYTSSMGLDGRAAGRNTSIEFKNTELQFDWGWSWENFKASWRLNSPSSIYTNINEAATSQDIDTVVWDCDFRESSNETFGSTIYVYDDCGHVTGSYDSSYNYNLHLTNFPAEDFGLPSFWNDIRITDDYGDNFDLDTSASFYEEFYYDSTEADDFLGEERTFAIFNYAPMTPTLFMLQYPLMSSYSVMEEVDIESVIEAEMEDAEEDYDSDESDLEYLADDFDGSTLERDLERFSEEIEEEIEKMDEPELRYEDGLFKAIWDTESRTFVSYQLSVQEDGNWKSMLGPNFENLEDEGLSGMKTYLGSESLKKHQEAKEMRTPGAILGLESESEEGMLEALPYLNLLWIVLAIVCVATVCRPND
jgi:hypothetical protein